MKKIIQKVAGIIIEDRKLLVVKEYGKDVFFSPGGKVEGDTNNKAVLIRELAEELNISVSTDDLQPFGEYKAEAAGKDGVVLKMQVLLVTHYRGQITPQSEIEALAWVTSSNNAGLSLGSIFEKNVIPELTARDLID